MSKVHCRSAFGPGASRLPYYCALLVCIPDVMGGLTMWQHNNPKNKPRKMFWKMENESEECDGAGGQPQPERGLPVPGKVCRPWLRWCVPFWGRAS